MKKLFSLILSVISVITVIFNIPTMVSADSMYIKKIVSVVYDDSTSMIPTEIRPQNPADNISDEILMKSPKWKYANYAMQAFCGMLNSEDQLFITYMSDIQTKEMDLSEKGIQKSVDSIRKHNSANSTPEKAVKVAFDKLKSVEDNNPNTQYWLVVFTDGIFNICQNTADTSKWQGLVNDIFGKDLGDKKMPNGTELNTIFFSIGDQALAPTIDGIEKYKAEDANHIIQEMARVADTVSGRKRLEGDALKEEGGKITALSKLPLQNIVVFEQQSDATLKKIVVDNEKRTEYEPSRDVSVGFGDDLKGRIFLVEEEKKQVIPSGTYEIYFDKAVNLENIIVLFEPALTVKMMITINGEEVKDSSALEKIEEGDKISVSYKVCEMGTDKEIDAKLLSDAKFEIVISENGKEKRISGMELKDYVAKNDVETKIKAAVTIDGFSPIENTVEFKPTFVVVDYSVTPEFLTKEKSIKLDELSKNETLGIAFSVLKDGQPLTDIEELKRISIIESGAKGEVSYSEDGKIIFIPTSAKEPSSHNGSFDVDVICKIDDGKKNTKEAKETFTVQVATYGVVGINADSSVKKTGFFGNQTGASFYITKDGVKLTKKDVEQNIEAVLNEEHSALKTDIKVADDGTITVIPYSEDEHKLTFWTWWVNWAYYFGLPSEDVAVTLMHPLGAGEAKIDVVEETISYQILNVYIPLLIELTALGFLIAWIVLIIIKPRYLKSAKLYVAEIKYNKEGVNHTLRNFRRVGLEKFNKIKRGNGRLKFKKEADIVSANGIRIRADHGGRIICEMPFPWYRGQIEPCDTDVILRTPAEIADYFNNHRKLDINEFATTETVEGEHERGITASGAHRPRYYVVPDDGKKGVSTVDDRKVIKSGKIFIYINA